jgi:hypothetical protein
MDANSAGRDSVNKLGGTPCTGQGRVSSESKDWQNRG